MHDGAHTLICIIYMALIYFLAEELDGGEYLFAFRMLMVLFRREFSFLDSLYLWEVSILSYADLANEDFLSSL